MRPTPSILRRVLAPGLIGALAAGLAGCGSGTAGAATGPYGIVPDNQRAAAPSFAGVTGRGRQSSVAAGRGRIMIIGFDIPGAPAPKAQLSVLRRAYFDLRAQRVRLLQVTLTGRDLVSVRVAIQGHIVTYPLKPAVDLAAEVYQLSAVGLGYTLIVDREGRIAARLIGTSDLGRLEQTVQSLVQSGG